MRLQNITVGITWDYKKIAVGIIKITVGITFGITKRRWDYSVITKQFRDYVTVTLGLQYGYSWITFIYLPLGRVVTRNPSTLQRQISQNVTLDFREKLSKNPIYYSDNFHKK